MSINLFGMKVSLCCPDSSCNQAQELGALQKVLNRDEKWPIPRAIRATRRKTLLPVQGRGTHSFICICVFPDFFIFIKCVFSTAIRKVQFSYLTIYYLFNYYLASSYHLSITIPINLLSIYLPSSTYYLSSIYLLSINLLPVICLSSIFLPIICDPTDHLSRYVSICLIKMSFLLAHLAFWTWQ